jgi:extracellular elastinolytic metalloproteinase
VTKKLVVLGMVLLLAMTASQVAFAGKKKKPKPWKSEEVSLGIAHTALYGSSGEVNLVTAMEFEQACALPASQGLDAWVFEVPAEYQKITASAKAIGVAGGAVGYDLDMFFYDADCTVTLASQATGTDESGLLPAGTSWIVLHNYQGDPNTMAHIELSVL